LARLLDQLGVRVQVGRVGRHMQLDGARLHRDDRARNAAEAGAARDHCARPRAHDLVEGVAVEEAAQVLALAARLALEHPARVVGLLGGLVLDGAVDGVEDGHEDWEREELLVEDPVGHEGEPLEDEGAAVEVVGDHAVRDAVVVHDFDAAQLAIGVVDLAAEYLLVYIYALISG